MIILLLFSLHMRSHLIKMLFSCKAFCVQELSILFLTSNTITFINWLWPSNAIWRQRSTLAGWCQTARCYLSQCWLVINKVLLHSPESSFTARALGTVLYNEFENHAFKSISSFVWFTSVQMIWFGTSYGMLCSLGWQSLNLASNNVPFGFNSCFLLTRASIH